MKSARFASLENRIERSLGVSVWFDRTDDPELPYEVRPWAAWTRDRQGVPYMIFPCVNGAGDSVEPGDWALEQLRRSMFANRHGLRRGAGKSWFREKHEAHARRISRRRQERFSNLQEKLLDGMKHEANVGRPLGVGWEAPKKP